MNISAPEAQPKANRFVCSTCGRAYKAKESLTRHKENHTGATRHICSHCGIGFHRMDLLSRHNRVHATVGSKRSGDSRCAGRQRTHRACDACKAMKTKCDSQDPCSSCTKRAHQCTYTKPSQRLSQAHAIRTTTRSRNSHSKSPSVSSTIGMIAVSHHEQPRDHRMHNAEFEEDESVLLQQHGGVISSSTGPASDAVDVYPAPVTDGNVHPPAMDSCSTLHADQTSAGSNPSQDMPLLSPVLQMDFNQFWQPDDLSQTFSWPWLFEESYLQQSPAVADTYMFGGLPESSLFEYNLSGSQYFPPDLPALSTVSLNAYANPKGSDTQPTIEQAVQFSFRNSTEDTAGRTPGPLKNANSGLAQDNLEMGQRENQSIVDQNRRRQVVQKMIDTIFQECSDSKSSPNAQQYRSQVWNMLCPEIERAFLVNRNENAMLSQPHILHEFVALYFRHFNMLWPMIWQHGLNYDDIPGPLYLALAMIGSMYAGGNAPAFGFMVHEYISRALMLAPTWRLDADDATCSTCLSLLLTQVASLYFGTKKAFSCAQQLESILVSLARKIGLFNRSASRDDAEDGAISNPTREATLVCKWTENEGRKRLAFGIFRADTFLSLLLNTRPLLSHEEISLSMPCPNFIWEYSAQDLKAYIKMNTSEAELQREMPFSDLVRIAMDRAELLPALKPGGYELLMFALQHAVWRFSHDPDTFRRLTGKTPSDPSLAPAYHDHDICNDHLPMYRDIGLPISETRPNSSSRAQAVAMDDTLDWSRRKMADLNLDYERTLCALKKWKQSFAAAITSAQSGHDRDLLLSGRLLYHLSFIRLNAEVEAFHLLSHPQLGSKRLQRESLRKVHQWSRSPPAQVAVEHACTVWNVVHTEIQRTGDRRARFNIIAFISLHHAASVIWAYAGTRDSKHDNNNGSSASRSLYKGYTAASSAAQSDQHEGIHLLQDLELCRTNTRALLSKFAALLRSISPAWVAVSAFATTAAVMADNPLPLLDP